MCQIITRWLLAADIDERGRRYPEVGVRWFTNLDAMRHEPIIGTRLHPDEYPRYENYDAIDVGRTQKIFLPLRYGIMGVPITYRPALIRISLRSLCSLTATHAPMCLPQP